MHTDLHHARVGTLAAVGGAFKDFFEDGAPLTINVHNDAIFNKSKKIDVTISEIEHPSCNEQAKLAGMFADNVGSFVKGMITSANDALKGLESKEINVFGQTIVLAHIFDIPADVQIPGVVVNQIGNGADAIVDMQATFSGMLDTLKKSGITTDVSFCVTPSLCDGELRLELNLTITGQWGPLTLDDALNSPHIPAIIREVCYFFRECTAPCSVKSS